MIQRDLFYARIQSLALTIFEFINPFPSSPVRSNTSQSATRHAARCGKMRQECGKLRQVAGLLPRDLQSYRACDSAGSIFQAASDDFSKCCACKPNTLQTKAFSAVCQLYIRSNKVGRKQQIAFRSHTCHHLIFGL